MKHFCTMSFSVMDGQEYASLDAIAYEGPCILYSKLYDFFSEGKGCDYYSEVLQSPTWGQVFLHAMKSQQSTLDFSHSYLEDLRKVGEREGVPILQFILGS